MHFYWSYLSRQPRNLRPGKSSGIATPRGRIDRSLIFGALIGFVLALPAGAVATTKHATVHRKVNLREQPTTASSAHRLLQPGESLELVSPESTSGFHKVKTSQGDEGFVWSPNIKVRHPNSPAGPATPIPPAGTAEADVVSTQWEKPAPAGETFQTCGPGGKVGCDAKTNERKNRIDVPSAYHAVQFVAIADTSKLPYPAKIARSRQQWSSDDAKAIAQFEGAAVQVRGHLSRQVKSEGAESTNCGETVPAKVNSRDSTLWFKDT